MFKWLTDLFQFNYGSELEHYILSKYPQNVGDVDRLTLEFNRKAEASWL
jgi:hypothetical protein